MLEDACVYLYMNPLAFIIVSLVFGGILSFGFSNIFYKSDREHKLSLIMYVILGIIIVVTILSQWILSNIGIASSETWVDRN